MIKKIKKLFVGVVLILPKKYLNVLIVWEKFVRIVYFFAKIVKTTFVKNVLM